MSIEVTCLYGATVLGLLQLLLATHFVTLQRGFKWNLSSREQSPPALTGVAGRLDRASKNFLETFPYFAVAILIVQLLGRNSAFSELGAKLYLGSRVIYLPVYAAGVEGLRSAIWLMSLLGLALVLFTVVA